MENNTRLIIRFILVAFYGSIGLYVLYHHFPLFKLTYVLNDNKVSNLTPDDRVIIHRALGANFAKQIDDLVYFTTNSKGFDRAKVTLKYILPDPSQEIYIGFRDRAAWHYKMKSVNLPLINQLDWSVKNKRNPAMYAKNGNLSLDQLLHSQNRSVTVGTYHLDDETLASHTINELPGYRSSLNDTEINTDLRGNHVLYVYVENEQFHFEVTKKDINQYAGHDPLILRVMKDGKLLTEKVAQDDGITDVSKESNSEQTVAINYEGGFPENGVYVIKIESGGDSIITKLKTNLSKIVFEGRVFAAPGPLTLYTDAHDMSFETYHSESLQTVLINGVEVHLNEVNTKIDHRTNNDYSQIVSSVGDIVITGAGYFSFTKDQYFSPFIYKRYEIKNQEDLEKVDYLLTDYERPENNKDSWRENTQMFEIKDAFYQNDKLSWIVHGPGLKESGREFYIIDTQIVLERDPIIQR